MRLIRNVILAILLVFVVPALATAGWWSLKQRPNSWRNADWSSAQILPSPPEREEAAVYLMAARTGGLKGAFSLHSWLVIKKPGLDGYDRYDKVGWGSPIRHNAYAADGRWYSNTPRIVDSVVGAEAEHLIPALEKAIANYRYSKLGDYRLWPGPNSNSFIAHVLRSVPELGMSVPSNATGRDFAPGLVAFDIAPDWRDIHFTIGGLAGFAIGSRSGIEVHFAGLVAGFDFARAAIKIPAYGQVPIFGPY